MIGMRWTDDGRLGSSEDGQHIVFLDIMALWCYVQNNVIVDVDYELNTLLRCYRLDG